MIRSRKLLEFHNALTNNREDFPKAEKIAFRNLSRVLHNSSEIISKRTIKTIFKIISRYQVNTIRPNCIINIKNINVMEIAKNKKNELYSHRIILEGYLKSCLKIVQYKNFMELCKSKNVEPVIGRLFKYVKDNGKLSEKMRVSIANTLPIINTVYHSGDIYGLSVNDISDINIKSVQEVIDVVVKEID